MGHSFSWGPILCIGQCGRSNTTNQQFCPQYKTTFLHLLWLFQFHVELPTCEISWFHIFLLNFIGNFNSINVCVKLTKRMKLRVVRIHLVFIVRLLITFFQQKQKTSCNEGDGNKCDLIDVVIGRKTIYNSDTNKDTWEQLVRSRIPFFLLLRIVLTRRCRVWIG